MKYLITESKISNIVSMYLDNQDFVQIGYGENIYLVNSEKDEYAQIGYNVKNHWCVISYDLVEEIISFFSLSYSDIITIVTKWFENKFGVETSMSHTQPKIIVYYF